MAAERAARTRQLWKMDLVDCRYEELGRASETP